MQSWWEATLEKLSSQHPELVVIQSGSSYCCIKNLCSLSFLKYVPTGWRGKNPFFFQRKRASLNERHFFFLTCIQLVGFFFQLILQSWFGEVILGLWGKLCQRSSVRSPILSSTGLLYRQTPEALVTHFRVQLLYFNNTLIGNYKYCCSNLRTNPLIPAPILLPYSFVLKKGGHS